MKPKVFREPLWPILLPFCLIFTMLSLLPLGCAVFLAKELTANPHSPTAAKEVLGILVFSAGAIAGVVGVNNHYFYDIAFGRLCVYKDKVVLRRFLRRPRVMTIESCKYIGVDDYSLLNRGLPISRGDEISYVYLSEQPYPQKYHGKISMLKNKKGFIKFHYSDKLAEALFAVLPDEKTCLLRSFYGKMKANDSLVQAEKRKNKKKKK